MPIPLPSQNVPSGQAGVVPQLGNPQPLQAQVPLVGGQQLQPPQMPVMVAPHVQQPAAPVNPAQQQQGLMGAVGGQQLGQQAAAQGEVYTMADLHQLAISQGRRLRFRRRRNADQSYPERH